MIAVVDYGVGNLYSLLCSLRHIGADCAVTREEEALRRADQIILPGVGAFGDAADRLRALGLDRLLQTLAKDGKPLMGICLGMQLLFEYSLEYGTHAGLGLIPGAVRPLASALPKGMKTPHMGWNSLTFRKPEEELLADLKPGAFVYYVHSFYATDCEDSVSAASEYGGVSIAGLVRRSNVCGCQFHPEKSGQTGLHILKRFARGDGPC